MDIVYGDQILKNKKMRHIFYAFLNMELSGHTFKSGCETTRLALTFR
jgi:hypothetical protein